MWAEWSGNNSGKFMDLSGRSKGANWNRPSQKVSDKIANTCMQISIRSDSNGNEIRTTCAGIEQLRIMFCVVRLFLLYRREDVLDLIYLMAQYAWYRSSLVKKGPSYLNLKNAIFLWLSSRCKMYQGPRGIIIFGYPQIVLSWKWVINAGPPYTNEKRLLINDIPNWSTWQMFAIHFLYVMICWKHWFLLSAIRAGL